MLAKEGSTPTASRFRKYLPPRDLEIPGTVEWSIVQCREGGGIAVERSNRLVPKEWNTAAQRRDIKVVNT